MTTDLDVICHESTTNRRKVPSTVHKQAFTEYGYSFPHTAGAFEVVHFIPLELGGDNTTENLWAEPASPQAGVSRERSRRGPLCTSRSVRAR
jgi:hypothetical protein